MTEKSTVATQIAAELQAGDGTAHFCRIVSRHTSSELQALSRDFPIATDPTDLLDLNRSLQAACFLARIFTRYEVFARQFPSLDSSLDSATLSQQLVARILEYARPHTGRVAATRQVDFYELALDLMSCSRFQEAMGLLEISAPGYKDDHAFWLLACRHNLAKRSKDRQLIEHGIEMAEKMLSGEITVPQGKTETVRAMLTTLRSLTGVAALQVSAG